MKFAPIIDPSVRRPSPKPVRVDLRKVFTFGTALWAIALVICMILLAFGINVERLQTMCAAGTVIGVLMLVWGAFRPVGLPPSWRITRPAVQPIAK